MSKRRNEKLLDLLSQQVPDLEHNASSSTGLTPLLIIRTETVISRLPIHNLVKGGEVNIQISRKNENGKVTLHWEVSPSSRFGHPGQLAYKLDTIVINRIIDEIGRPVPKLIKIGTLNQLCKELGSQKGELKKSLRQNAATTISAKLSYKSNEGQERKLEAIFSRYSVIFTGETLPNGEKADEIYVIFNDPYLEVLNSAPVRPLNYEYLKVLSPTSQRFYEIVSYRIYAALRYDHPRAKMLYSEYCTYSAQRRHEDFEHARIQMYRVHKPHLESSYITKVDYEKCVDEEGRPDWMIYYTPGIKAKAEFHTFNRKQIALSQAESDNLPDNSEAEKSEREIQEQTTGLSAAELATPVEPTETALVRYFHQLARGKRDYQPSPASKELKQAAILLKKYSAEKAKHIIEVAVREARKTNFQMRTFGAVLQYVNEAEQEFEHQAVKQQRQAQVETKLAGELRTEQEAYRHAEEKLNNLSDQEFGALYEKIREELFRCHSAVMARFDEIALDTTIRAGMIKELVYNQSEYEA